ncbi:putative cathepsin H [Helianthus annuus]|uniref:Cathepsin H n=1 Tax=Helianthus annuus TaxID=4232 RepID=A0A9K3IUG8_HELAN|nr:putative cathepsin H [Helianthus annuus]KAJ0574151.1 putative cathepsin H [Helianthus annuus]KAJ0738485.1 putative cathepsin H [Helianthus annuus]KAJ0741371.1 putative cathepsin H [Helianthus annuus]
MYWRLEDELWHVWLCFTVCGTIDSQYQSSEEMKHRYSIFAESLETIRSHNKWLSYTLGVNGSRVHRRSTSYDC